jgi:hypothetical protein
LTLTVSALLSREPQWVSMICRRTGSNFPGTIPAFRAQKG